MSDREDVVLDNDSGDFLPVAPQEISPAIAAEISQQVATAKRYPRRRDKEISDEIMGRATLNESIAAECMYSLKRGEKMITGPSIRFAEIVRASFGNIRVAARFVRLDLDDPERGAVIVEAAAHDMQTNNAEIIPVRRSVMTSGYGGKKPRIYNADMINMTVNAASSLARRNAVLAVVPKALWIDGFQRVVSVLQGDATTLAARRKDIMDAFARIEVPPADVYAALGVKSIEDITVEHMPQLKGFMTAISEGETAASVLGKAAENAGGDHEKVANPLQDKPEPKKVEATAPGTGPAAGAEVKLSAAGQASDPKPDPEKKPVAEKKPAASKIETSPHAEPLAAIKTPEAYKAHSMGWIAAGTEIEPMRAQWSRERIKRGELGVMEEMLIEINKAYTDKIKALQKAVA
jgi:hypothetical protein